MKVALRFQVIGLLLYCTLVAAQEPTPAPVKAPFAGATISDFKGKVGIQIPGQALKAPSRGDALPPETEINTEDGRLLLRLMDGSDVVVRPRTRLVLKEPETSGWRYLQLLIGRIQTRVQKHFSGTPPVQIGTPSAVISVRGTQFDVEVDRRRVTEVDVTEGVVELSSTRGGDGVMITAGFSSRVSMESAPEVPRPTHDLRPQLDRPGRSDSRGSGDDDPLRSLIASESEHSGGSDSHDGGTSGSSGSSGSDGGGKT
ncbi:MAG TPA: FecR family protein, partial [Candidatus Angelobacter sp.]|nr:FecR family protein [Candidatus Angelobacter sp.]